MTYLAIYLATTVMAFLLFLFMIHDIDELEPIAGILVLAVMSSVAGAVVTFGYYFSSLLI
tara:strand:- start:1833 stop:2012 length:180 start_codon:yes stop_codon:yes gene_type:complete